MTLASLFSELNVRRLVEVWDCGLLYQLLLTKYIYVDAMHSACGGVKEGGLASPRWLP